MDELKRAFERVSGQVQKLERRIATEVPLGVLEARIVALEASMREKACSRQLQALDVSLMSIASKVPALEQIHKQNDSVEKMQKSVRSNCDKIQHLEGRMVGMQSWLRDLREMDVVSKIASLERSQVSVASADRVQQLQEAQEEDLGSIRQLQGAVGNLKEHISEISKNVRDKATVMQVRTLEQRFAQLANTCNPDSLRDSVAEMERTLLSALDVQVTRIDRTMSQKVSIEDSHGVFTRIESDVVSLSKKHEDMQTLVCDLGAGLNEKACSNKLNSTAMALQIQMTQITNSLNHKAGFDRLEELSSLASGFDVKVNNLVQDLQSGRNHMRLLDGDMKSIQQELLDRREKEANLGDLHLMRTSLAELDAKIHGIDKELQEKPNHKHLHEVKDTMSQFEDRVAEIGAMIDAGVAKLPHLETGMASIRAQLANLEKDTQRRETMEELERAITSTEEGVVELEQQAKHGASRLGDLEDKVTHLRDEFSAFQHGFDDGITKVKARDYLPTPTSKPYSVYPGGGRRDSSAPY